ncbi:hypothetical protein CR513_23622, partial [Mucuna pruriens]
MFVTRKVIPTINNPPNVQTYSSALKPTTLQGDIIVLSLNIKDASNNIANKHDQDIIKKHKSYFIILIESHIQFDRTKTFWNQLRLHLVFVEEGMKKWACIGPYPNNLIIILALFICTNINNPWLFGRNYNENLLRNEQKAVLSQVLDTCGLLDLYMNKECFTWYKNDRNKSVLTKKLDKKSEGNMGKTSSNPCQG